MNLSTFVLAAVMQTAAAPPIPVDAARTDWSAFPRLQRAVRPLPTPNMVDGVENILAESRCSLPGQTAERFDIDVPFAVLVEPNGSARRVIVQDMGCPAIEALVGQVAVNLARAGDFRATGEPEARWYRDSINFILQR